MVQNQTFVKRKLIGLERYYLYRPAINTLMAARIKGNISVDEIKPALAKILKKHPLLSSVVSVDEEKNVWLESNDTAILPLKVVHRESTDAWMNVVLEESKCSFLLSPEPMVRFVLLQSPDSSDIVINAHHMICDGMSLTYLIRDMISYLNNPEKEAKPISYTFPLGKSDLPSSVNLNIKYRLMIGIFNALWKKKGVFFNEYDYQELHHTYWAKARKRGLLTWELSDLQTIALIKKCKHEKVTINSAIVTAFYLAQVSLQGEQSKYLRSITIPVNTRNRLKDPPGDVIGTYISAFKLKPNIKQGKPFWDQARSLQKKIKKQLTDENIFTLPLQMMYLEPALIDSMSFIKHGMLDDRMGKLFLKTTGEQNIVSGYDISNVGLFDRVDDGKYQLDWIYGPFLFEDVYEKFLGIITVENKMMFSISYDELIIDTSLVKKNRDAAMDYLEKAVLQ